MTDYYNTTDLENASFLIENPGTLYTTQILIQKIKDAIAALTAIGMSVSSITTSDISVWIAAHP